MAEVKGKDPITPVGELRKWFRDTREQNRAASLKDKEEFMREKVSREKRQEKKIAQPKLPEMDR